MIIIHSILAFLGVLALLIVVHELGHYYAARWCGVKVLRFSIGMGKIIFSRRLGADQTEWVLSAFPLGGYVKMLDSRDLEAQKLLPEERAREFTNQTVWKRIAIVAAGPIANFLLAIGLFTALYVYGIPEPVANIRVSSEQSIAYQAGLRTSMRIVALNTEPIQSWRDLRWKLMQLAVAKQPALLDVRIPDSNEFNHATFTSLVLPTEQLSSEDLNGNFLEKLGITVAHPPAVLKEVVSGGAAEHGGLKKGDEILFVNGLKIIDGMDFIEQIRTSPGENLEIEILRQNRQMKFVVTPDVEQQEMKVVGKINVAISMAPEMIVVQENLLSASWQAIKQTFEMSVLTVKMLGKIILGEASLKNITGPITIADYAGQTAQIGVVSYLSFIALISISLGVMNLLPIPVLDGGLLMYYSWEILTRRPVSKKFEEMAQRVGFGILAALMAVAFFNDITRLFS